jgi:hypothetical protein
MRLASIILGVVILAFGILLVSTNGVVAGVNLPGLIGYPSCTSGSSANSTSPQCFGFAGFGVGTVVCIFGLGLVASGLRTSSASQGVGRGAGSLPPELAAALTQAQQNRTAAAATAPSPGSRFCPECGRANAPDAKFCQGCGRPMPPPPPPVSSPPAGSTVPPPPP